jgi:hypothetical protein
VVRWQSVCWVEDCGNVSVEGTVAGARQRSYMEGEREAQATDRPIAREVVRARLPMAGMFRQLPRAQVHSLAMFAIC